MNFNLDVFGRQFSNCPVHFAKLRNFPGNPVKPEMNLALGGGTVGHSPDSVHSVKIGIPSTEACTETLQKT
jgi:hypothetical protein